MAFWVRAEGDVRAHYSNIGVVSAFTVFAAVLMFMSGELAIDEPDSRVVGVVVLALQASVTVLMWWVARRTRWRLTATTLTVGTGRRTSTVPLSRVRAVALILGNSSPICVWWDRPDGSLALVRLFGPQAFAFKFQTRAPADASYWERVAGFRAAVATTAITTGAQGASGLLDLGVGRPLVDLVWKVPAAARDFEVRFWTSLAGGVVDHRELGWTPSDESPRG